MKSVATQCGHVKRRLSRNEPLKGKSLQFALSLIPQPRGHKDDQFFVEMSDKLIAGTPLGEYEYHILVEVLLLHTRLGCGEEPWMTQPVNSKTGSEIIAAMHDYVARQDDRRER